VQRAIERFAFGRPVDAELAAGMAVLRRRMEPRPERGRGVPLDLKRGPGGMVDVEFIAQLLQLRYGRTRPALRSTGTRQTLHRLLEHGLLSTEEGEFLLEAYDRLRGVTKAMRIDRDQGEETLPEGRELEVLARAVGRPTGPSLKAEIVALMQETRRIFERFFGDHDELADPVGRDER
jgi:glutamate-ammonia-ligase adenylyltransferase